MRISHPTGIIRTSVDLPSSKSLSNRALLIRFLSGKDFSIHDISRANDTVLLQHFLESHASEADVQDAGTAFRFLTAALSITPGEWRLTGTARLQERPIKILVDALLEMGADIRYEGNEGFAPLLIRGNELTGGSLALDSSVSSQFISALLMIAPKLKRGLHLKLNGKTVSEPYISMTLKLMEYFGVNHEWLNGEIIVPAQLYTGIPYTVEPDWSAASYWYEMAALSQTAEIFLDRLRLQSLQGDARISSLANPLGVVTKETGDGILITKDRDFSLPAFYEADFLDNPDLVPAVTAVLAGLQIKSRITGIENLDLKESKRKEVLSNELLRNGIAVSPEDHSIHLNGGALVANPEFHVHKDHRMAMCFAPLALCSQNVSLDEGGVVQKSYPEYWSHLEKAGFQID
jgi:3-phosphoshikimate 1-carboxyvinyltransferase